MAIRSKIPSDLLQRIKDTVGIAEIVGEHVVLRKSGNSYSGLCPFHSERTPSFNVNPNKGLYHCYGCKKGGDVLNFVMELHGLSFPEAVEELSERSRIPLPKDWSGDDAGGDPEMARLRAANREKLQLAYKLNRFAAAFYHQLLPRYPEAHQYLRSRGIDAETERQFYVGAAPREWDALSKHLIAKKAPLALAAELGLIRPSQKSGPGCGYFDLFRNRALFPILDVRGRVAGFGGRVMPGSDEKPKYLNSPESLVFKKSKLAFGLYQASKHARETDEMVLVEGYFDVAALHRAGFNNAVAVSGTSFSADHLQMFRRLSSKLVILFDGDKAGMAGTDRAMELGLEHGWVIHGATIPDGLDPDEVLFDQGTGALLPLGQERMKAILAGAKPLLDTRIDGAVLAAQAGPEARTQALKQIGAWLHRFKDPVGREVRLQSVQERLGVSRQLLDRAMGGTGGGTRQHHPSEPRGQPENQASQRVGRSTGKLPKAEKILLSAIVRGGELTDVLVHGRRQMPPKTGISDLFSYPPAKEFVAALWLEPGNFERLRNAPETFLTGEMDPQVRSTITEALVSGKTDSLLEEVQIAFHRRASDLWARFSHQIKVALTEAELKQDAELHSKLMKEFLDVSRKMKEFSCFYDEA